jgi:hypothetical protein
VTLTLRPHDRLEGHGDRERGEEDPITASLQSQERNEGRKDGQQVAPGLREDYAALLGLGPELLELAPEDAAQHDDEKGRAEQDREGEQRVGGEVAEVLAERAGHGEEEAQVNEGAGDRKEDLLDEVGRQRSRERAAGDEGDEHRRLPSAEASTEAPTVRVRRCL